MNYLGMNRQAEQVDGPSLYFIGMLCLEQMTNKEIRHELKFKKKRRKMFETLYSEQFEA